MEITNGNYIEKLIKHDGLDNNDCDFKNSLPDHFGDFLLSSGKRILNNFIRELNGFCNNNIIYTDMDSLYIEKKVGIFI